MSIDNVNDNLVKKIYFGMIKFMLYFSELEGKKVQTEDEVYVGKFEDLVFQASQTPLVTKIVIKHKKNKLIIPINSIKKINSIITLNKNFLASELEPNELFVLKNLLDKQIIDLKGNKVVRVNDVIVNDKPSIYISGVDVAFMGIFRRLGLEQLVLWLSKFLFLSFKAHILSWADIQPLELSRGKVILNQTQEKIKNLHPADLADYLEKTNVKNISKFINLLDSDLATKVISELNSNFQLSLFKRLSKEKAEKLIDNMDIDEATDIISQLSTRKKKQIFETMDKSKKNLIEKSLKLSGSSVGRYLSTDFITVKPEEKVGQVMSKIKKESADIASLDYIFVTNDQKQLVGVFSLYELLLQDLNTPVFKFMTQNIFAAHFNSPIMTVIRRLIKYHLYALPIVDNNNQFIGIIKRDDTGEFLLNTKRL